MPDALSSLHARWQGECRHHFPRTPRGRQTPGQPDFEEFFIRTKLSSAARPGQVIVYHAWEPYQHRNWKSSDAIVPGMIKWLHLAGGYGHLNYWRWNWVQQQVDRAVRVEIEKMS
jgi:hypothetical protein